MKIGILTHPLGVNYGGILQAYALSTILQQMGHEVVVLRRDHDMPFVKQLVKNMLIAFNHPRYNNPKYRYLRQFVAENIPESPRLSSSMKLEAYTKRAKLDMVIVGSDQVWRTDFAMGFGYDYFLNFVPDNVKRVSYAASFGLSDWLYTEGQTIRIKDLLRSFNGVSVREYDGQLLCREHLDCDAAVVLDPTMLLASNHYDTITSPRIINEDYVYVYWLGSEVGKQKILNQYKDKHIIDISLRQGEPLSSIGDWLSYIKYADRVVTDSFHGCVFSMLFNRQFVMHVNKSGGFGRIESLYKLFGLEYKLADPYQEVDYSKFEERLAMWREKSMNYLKAL